MTPAPVDLTDDELRHGLTACLAVPRWVDEVAARAPYSSLQQLLDVAAAAADPLTAEEIEGAIAHHPRIGENPQGNSAASALSRSEQQSSASDDQGLAERLTAGNAAYEQRFGRIFLIRAAGRTREQILAELDRRLELSPEEDITIVGSELRAIALGRIPQLFGHLDGHSGFDASEAAR